MSDDRRAVVVPVAEVLLLEDRAHVTRRGRAQLPEGLCRLRIADASPVISDRTLTAHAVPLGANGRAGAAARVHDVRVRRERRVTLEERTEEVRVLDEEIAALASEQAALAARRASRVDELAGLAQVAELTVAEIGEDAAWDRSGGDAWNEALDRLGVAEREAAIRIVETDFEIAELRERLAGKQLRRKVLDGHGARRSAWIEIDLTSVASGEHELVVSYVVPSACWRPRHTAHLSRSAAGEARVRFECEGSAWQSTGEDWKDVELCFSTERASLGAEPPLLTSDVLAVTRKNPALVVQEREHKIEQSGLGAGEAARPEGLPGIDDGGDAQRLRAEHRVTVPSDGRPHRVPLYSFEAPAQTELVVMPELAQAVILKSVQTNVADRPILAGPVDLVRDSGFVGRASVLFVAPGEKFALGWGPDGSLRVQREVEHLKEESNLIGSWITRAQEVRVHLSNLGPEPKELRLTERVPVSEIEKVQITLVPKETTEGKRSDERGFVEWRVTLSPFGRETVRLRYVLKKHSDVVGI